jgi:hypothetical protein
MLRMGPICSYEFYETEGITHRLAARVYDLNRAGHVITSRPCKNQSHGHQSRAVLYELAMTDQLRLSV